MPRCKQTARKSTGGKAAKIPTNAITKMQENKISTKKMVYKDTPEEIRPTATAHLLKLVDMLIPYLKNETPHEITCNHLNCSFKHIIPPLHEQNNCWKCHGPQNMITNYDDFEHISEKTHTIGLIGSLMIKKWMNTVRQFQIERHEHPIENHFYYTILLL